MIPGGRGRWPRIQPVPGSGRWLRAEPFGATVAFRRPEMLVLVDRAFARRLGVRRFPEPAPAALPTDPARPYEAHLTLDAHCSQGCSGCYIDARPDAGPALAAGAWEVVLERLAALGVFHLALGGGEATGWDLLLHLAQRARRLGMTPNLTTAGLELTPRLARRLRVFERVHLSLNGVGDAHAAVCGHDGYERAVMGLRILRAFHPRVGINCVVARQNADRLAPLFALLDRLDVREVELLRFKPAGRGARDFEHHQLTPEQAAALVPRTLRLAWRHRLRVRLDCSFTPMVCATGVPPERLARFGLAGCVAGSWLVGIAPDGGLSGCSFDERTEAGWQQLGRSDLFAAYRRWVHSAPAPCSDCRWLPICRGGCHVIARHVCGDFHAPDPGCPLVRQAQSRGAG